MKNKIFLQDVEKLVKKTASHLLSPHSVEYSNSFSIFTKKISVKIEKN